MLVFASYASLHAATSAFAAAAAAYPTLRYLLLLQPRMHNKALSSAAPMPGWGVVSNPEDWKVVDEANDADEAAAASSSRIAQRVQQLSLDPSQPNSFLAEEVVSATTPAAAAAAAAAVPASRAAAADSAAGVQQRQHQQPLPPPPQQHPAAGHTSAAAAAAAGEKEEEEDDGWDTVASSKNAARRKKRKEFKRQERQRAFEQEWEEHAALVQQQQQQQVEVAAEPPVQQQNGDASAADAAAAADWAGSSSEGESEDGEAEGGEEATITNDDLLAAEHQVYTAEDFEEADEAAAAAADGAAAAAGSQQQQQQQGLAPGMPGWHSSVACVTADFAMQNVLLQMGLRLLTRDGRRIARLSRYALRCSACYNVTREPGRLFCPKCGNMTLDRVEVVVGPDGAEYFGMRKRHILRGTKFSLPKPRVRTTVQASCIAWATMYWACACAE
jgi:RNA-binding protein NOB1